MYAACEMFGLGANDEVLTPAFDCDGTLQPFRVLGYKLQFFRSNPYDFTVDIEDIKRKINRKTKLLHIINHFGMPQPWNELLKLRQESGIPILEDNAYSLFSEFDRKPFGTFGDASVFSLRKNLPLIDGGMLRINNPRYSLKLSDKKIPWLYPTEIKTLLYLAKDNLELNGFFKTIIYIVKGFGFFKELLPPLYSDEKSGYPIYPLRDAIGREFSCDYLRPMSGLAKRQLSEFLQEDYIEIYNKKRYFYSYLMKEIGQIKGINILWPVLPEGIIPFCLSLLIAQRRDIFLKVLRKKYSVMAWPALSNLVLERLENFPEVELLGRKLLQINLPANKVRHPGFSKYLQNLLLDIYKLSQKYL